MWRSVYVYPVGVCINGASVKWLRYLSCGAGESGASQGGSAVVKVSIIIFTPVGSHEVVQETVSARAAGWGGQGVDSDTLSGSSTQKIMINKADPTPASTGGGGHLLLRCSGVKNLQPISGKKLTLFEPFLLLFYTWPAQHENITILRFFLKWQLLDIKSHNEVYIHN